jgi:hypothetical protein
MRRWRVALAGLAAMVGVGVATPVTVAATAAAADPACATGWGSTTKQAGTGTGAHLTGVRAGSQPCFDRLVLDVDGPTSGYWVSYVPQITQDGSGAVIPTRGGAALQVVARAPAYDDAGRPTYQPANRTELVNVAGWPAFRQVVWAGSFEGDSSVGIGVRARLPFRVFTLDGPGTGSRIVVDIAHSW